MPIAYLCRLPVRSSQLADNEQRQRCQSIFLPTPTGMARYRDSDMRRSLNVPLVTVSEPVMPIISLHLRH